MERGILVQRSMGPRLIIVGSVDADDPAQVRFTEHDDVVRALPAPRQPDEQQTIGVVEGRSLWRPAPEHIDLLAKNQDLRFTPRAGLEQSNERTTKQSEQLDHRATASPDSHRFASYMEFPTGTTVWATGSSSTVCCAMGSTMPFRTSRQAGTPRIWR